MVQSPLMLGGVQDQPGIAELLGSLSAHRPEADSLERMV